MNKISLFSENHEFSSYYHISGNVALEEAEVILVADIYNDHGNRDKNVEFINAIWHNHLLLVEIAPYGQKISSCSHRLTRNIREDIVIEGWDLLDFCRQLQNLEERDGEITHLIEQMHSDLAQGAWGLFLRKDESFETLLSYGSSHLQKDKKEIRSLLMQGQHELFHLRLKEVIAKIHQEQQALVGQVYTHFFQKRLFCLEQAIEGGIKRQAKVIVLLAGSLMLPNPRLTGEAFNLQKFEDYLKTKKFVMINAKHSFLLMPNQPELWHDQQPSSVEEREPLPAEVAYVSSPVIAPRPSMVLRLPWMQNMEEAEGEDEAHLNESKTPILSP